MECCGYHAAADIQYSGLRESCNFCVVDKRSVRMLKIQIPMLCGRNFVLYACVVHGWRFKFCNIDANRCSAATVVCGSVQTCAVCMCARVACQQYCGVSTCTLICTHALSEQFVLRVC